MAVTVPSSVMLVVTVTVLPAVGQVGVWTVPPMTGARPPLPACGGAGGANLPTSRVQREVGVQRSLALLTIRP